MSLERTGRDFLLLGIATDAARSVCTDALATIEVLHTLRPAKKQAAYDRIGHVREIAERFEHYVVTVQPAVLEYSPDMPEAALRAWAAALVAGVTS